MKQGRVMGLKLRITLPNNVLDQCTCIKFQQSLPNFVTAAQLPSFNGNETKGNN